MDGVAPINTPFDGYNQTPGESELVRNQNTHKQMTFEMGYGHRFNLLDSKFGSIDYVPSIGVGVMVGENLTVMIKEGQWWEFDDYKDKHGIQGFGGSITNRLEFNTPKERFGVFYEKECFEVKRRMKYPPSQLPKFPTEHLLNRKSNCPSPPCTASSLVGLKRPP